MTTSTPHSRPWVVPAGIITVGIVELALLVWIASVTSVWVPLLIVATGWIVGFALLIAAGQQSISRAISLVCSVAGTGQAKKHLSRPAFTLMAAMLFFFPGILTDIVALILLVTPVQEAVVDRSGLRSGGRTVLTGRGRVIDGEIVIDTVQSPHGASATSDTMRQGSAQTPPPMIEGGVMEGEIVDEPDGR